MSYHGKVIYNPSGKAAEYSYWAANFYNGCSAKCEYCYNRKGLTAKILGGDNPVLKASLHDEHQAYEIFCKEANENLSDLQKNGLFFNFVSDPCLPETLELNFKCIKFALSQGINVKLLTKQSDWVNWFIGDYLNNWNLDLISIGFTLTGHDELEPGASTNRERIEAMVKLHNAGFKTFGSFEPVIDFYSTLRMIELVKSHCDLFKIGLLSGSKHHYEEIRDFLSDVFELIPDKPIYLKDSLLKQASVSRNSIDLPPNCVPRNYNI